MTKCAKSRNDQVPIASEDRSRDSSRTHKVGVEESEKEIAVIGLYHWPTPNGWTIIVMLGKVGVHWNVK